MVIYDDDGIGHKVVPMSVIEDIKAEIKHLHDWAFNREEVIKIIDKHINRKEQEK